MNNQTDLIKKILFYLVTLFVPLAISAQSFIPWSGTEEKGEGCQHTHHMNLAEKEAKNPLLDQYDITYTRLNILTANASTYIEVYASINAKVIADEMNTFCIELSSDMDINTVFFNGSSSNFTHLNDEICVELDQTLYTGEQLAISILYDGDGHDQSNYAGGMHHIHDNILYNYEPLTYTFTQPFGAYVWFPCKQVLNDKIDSLHMFVTTGAEYKVSSNGILTEVVDLPDNLRRYEWKTSHPIAYYLVAFNVFNYEEYNFYTHPEGFNDSIFIQNFMVDAEHINEMKGELDKTHDAMNLYCNLFGMYPFQDEKYGHSIWGIGFGMEHQTMTSMPYNIDFRRLSHELSHQWFGNSVTCGSWQDIWLNEGFATYFDYLALKLLVSDATGEARMAYYHDKAMTNPNGSVYVPESQASNAGRIFDYKLSYCKAGAVIKMLRHELQDDDLFWQILTNYLAEHKNSFATTEDFQAGVEETSGMDFDYFFDQWIYGEGYPTIYGYWNWKEDTLTMQINEHTSYTSVTPLFKMLIPYRLDLEYGGDTTILLQQVQRNQLHKVYMPAEVEDVIIDPENELLNKVGTFNYYDPNNIDTYRLINCLVYPNPFTDRIQITIDSQHNEYHIRLFNSQGQMVFCDHSSLHEYVMNTAGLSAGVYHLDIRSGKSRHGQRLIKQ